MASITMDTSEYEALKKNISLLEESKQEMKELQDQITILNKEKIQILEDASNSVLVTNKHISEEYIYEVRPIDELLRYIKHRNTYSSDYSWHDIVYQFFKKVKADPVTTVHTNVKGFDEFKKELKNQYYSELDNDVKNKLEGYITTTNKLKSLKIDYDILKRENEDLKIKVLDKELCYKYIDSIKVILNKKWNIFNYLDLRKEIENNISIQQLR